MANKPFPFSVCEKCCVPGGGGETVIVNKGGYPYVEESMENYFRMIALLPNTVTYVYGATTESGELAFNIRSDDVVPGDESEETVIILDLTSSPSNYPTVVFDNEIKWMNGEPPTTEAGKVYIFSFVGMKKEGIIKSYLGVGGEFA